MGVRIKLAETTAERDALFRLRHKVMAEEEGYIPPTPGGRLYDRFDAYPTTANVIALVGDVVVGGIRFIEETEAGTTAEEYFDFRPHLPPDARPAASSMLVVSREYREVPRLVFALNCMGYYWAISRGISHILAPANPVRREAFLRAGHRVVAPEFVHPTKRLPVLPMILDLDELEDRFLAFVRRQGLQGWIEAFDREFYSAGEVVLRRGDPGRDAFIVVDGEAVVTAGDPAGPVLSEIGPGELFGEIALLTGRPRTATVVAATDLDLMVLHRDAFRARLRGDPAVGEHMLELVANRLVDLLDSLVPSGPG